MTDVLGFACGAADMGLAYSLLSRLRDGLPVLREKFEKHVRTTGLAAIDNLGETAESVRSQASRHNCPGTIARQPPNHATDSADWVAEMGTKGPCAVRRRDSDRAPQVQ